MEKVKRRRGYTRISRKNQATLPVDVLKRAGLRPGDELRAEAVGEGRVLLVRAEDLIERYAGCLTGVYHPGELEALRDEWQ